MNKELKIYRINVRANNKMIEDLKYIKKFLSLLENKDYSDSEVVAAALGYVANRIEENNIVPL